MDDYLENRLLPTATGLQTKNKYSVYSNTDRDTLVTALTKTSNWSEFASGVSGATATGGATNEMFVNSWNGNPAVNGRQLEVEKSYYGSTNGGQIMDPTKLYVPCTEVVEGCKGYWLLSPDADGANAVWNVVYDGVVGTHSYYLEYLRGASCSLSTIRHHRNSRRYSRNIGKY